MSHVFGRVSDDAPRIASAFGAQLWDTTGKRYLDAAAGAIVVGIGHGVTEVVRAQAEQAGAVAYAHGSMFRADVLEEYAAELAAVLPMDDPLVFPVSGGSEAVETALKMARAYHLARGEDRHLIVGRVGSYHGNSRGALDVSGRAGLRAPYLPWLEQAVHTSTPYEYRCPFPDTHPVGCGARHAAALAQLCRSRPVAAFIAEPIAGAGLGACVPPDDYWPAVAEVCRRYGVLLVADEVMTGFGRTGTWFGVDHWGVRPDILVAAKGASSGYWPLGLAVASGPVHDTIAPTGFTHGFTYSHHLVGAATGRAVLRVLRERDLVAAGRRAGESLRRALRRELADSPYVGDVRGRGLLVGVELVADQHTARPYARTARVAERVVAAARHAGLLLYSGTGCADGVDGDVILLGPPLVVSADEVEEIAVGTAAAIRAVTEPASAGQPTEPE
ncbi:aminotransferase class III-fold pyridoxal phosphate-dependent enzyme [Solwaraspora sp. WMMA2065]|uniref:aminotransferase family protein n=1 Tax=Solwaraspora sp. WMMA2065 TaxID=3015166 RepID=UPI00259BB8EE|nr:aminotransferase class III-fold pyridoxal phosphate-dependent enzyme [Solwaraspora sp. WMMA2065]WJK32403.1 aminotransferase class III-fold pyridoxal phosphate-dependent enzyme [Solwaraspora sp. WMMA2065]